MEVGMTIRDRVERQGDMHPTRSLKLLVQSDGDVIVVITQDGVPIGDIDTGSESDQAAQVEFCTSGGKSPRTRAALMELIVAMKEDNEHHPTR